MYCFSWQINYMYAAVVVVSHLKLSVSDAIYDFLSYAKCKLAAFNLAHPV